MQHNAAKSSTAQLKATQHCFQRAQAACIRLISKLPSLSLSLPPLPLLALQKMEQRQAETETETSQSRYQPAWGPPLPRVCAVAEGPVGHQPAAAMGCWQSLCALHTTDRVTAGLPPCRPAGRSVYDYC